MERTEHKRLPVKFAISFPFMRSLTWDLDFRLIVCIGARGWRQRCEACPWVLSKDYDGTMVKVGATYRMRAGRDVEEISFGLYSGK
jgi:hypothetical protein